MRIAAGDGALLLRGDYIRTQKTCRAKITRTGSYLQPISIKQNGPLVFEDSLLL
jgi:hypothetical protein